MLCGCKEAESFPVTEYLLREYNVPIEKGVLFAEDLCVAQDDVSLTSYAEDTNVN